MLFLVCIKNCFAVLLSSEFLSRFHPQYTIPLRSTWLYGLVAIEVAAATAAAQERVDAAEAQAAAQAAALAEAPGEPRTYQAASNAKWESHRYCAVQTP